MNPEAAYVLIGLLISMLVGLAAFFVARFREGIEIGSRIQPLSGDDRLRISLALSAFESAEKELAKAEWRDNQPGHPQVMMLRLDLMELRYTAQKLLRES